MTAPPETSSVAATMMIEETAKMMHMETKSEIEVLIDDMSAISHGRTTDSHSNAHVTETAHTTELVAVTKEEGQDTAHNKSETKSKKVEAEEGEKEQQQRCYAPTCPQTSTEALKRCARCRIALYCSRSCQTTDWLMHKVACRRSSQDPEIRFV